MTRVLKAHAVQGVRRDAAERLEAELAAEQERQAAVAVAYAAGYDDALAACARDRADAAPRAATALGQLVAAADHARQERADATSRAVLAAAIDVAEWVLRHELTLSSRSLLERLNASALALMPGATGTVHVSPYDEEVVRGWASGHEVEVVVDQSLGAGDARFETGAGSVDATVAAALRIAAEALGVDPSRVRT